MEKPAIPSLPDMLFYLTMFTLYAWVRFNVRPPKQEVRRKCLWKGHTLRSPIARACTSRC